MFPTAVLETTGAKTGARRRNAVIYFHDGDRVTIVASNAGSPRHPSWYHNLRAHPDVVFGGVAMRATVVDDERSATASGRSPTASSPPSRAIGATRRR